MKKLVFVFFAICFLFENFVFADDPNREQSHLFDEILCKSNYETQIYNYPAGTRELNLFGLNKVGQYNLNAVASPDFQYIAYSEVYFNPKDNQTTSAIFFIEPDSKFDKIEAFLRVSTKDKVQTPLIQSDLSKLINYKFDTFTIVDWNRASDKLLIKEYLGQNGVAVYGTKLYLYDFSQGKLISLNKIRDEVIKYYLDKKHIYLEDYSWKLVPLGFSSDDENKILVNVFSYRNNSPVFLGLWSISVDGNSVNLVSLEKSEPKISANGVSLKFKLNLEDLVMEQKEIDSKKTRYLIPQRKK